MRPKKILLRICIVLIIFFCAGLTLSAAEPEAQQVQQEEILEYGINLFDWSANGELENNLKAEAPQLSQFQLREAVTNLMIGKADLSINNILRQIGNLFIGEIGLFLQLGARFLLIVVLCNLLRP